MKTTTIKLSPEFWALAGDAPSWQMAGAFQNFFKGCGVVPYEQGVHCRELKLWVSNEDIEPPAGVEVRIKIGDPECTVQIPHGIYVNEAWVEERIEAEKARIEKANRDMKAQWQHFTTPAGSDEIFAYFLDKITPQFTNIKLPSTHGTERGNVYDKPFPAFESLGIEIHSQAAKDAINAVKHPEIIQYHLEDMSPTGSTGYWLITLESRLEVMKYIRAVCEILVDHQVQEYKKALESQ